MKQFILHVYGTPGKYNGYSHLYKDSKKAGKAFAKTIAAGVNSSLTQYIGNSAEWEIANY